MSTRQLLARIADLLLESDEATKDWLTSRPLRINWYVVCATTLVLLIQKFFRDALLPLLSSSAEATLIYRIENLGILIVLEGGILWLAIGYYKFVLSRKASIRLDNLVTFYAFSTLIFGFIYFYMYQIESNWFLYNDSSFIPGATIKEFGYWSLTKAQADFLLFSAFQTINGSFYKIQARSVFVSIVAYIQSLFSLGLITLFIASYVNQKTK